MQFIGAQVAGTSGWMCLDDREEPSAEESPDTKNLRAGAAGAADMLPELAKPLRSLHPAKAAKRFLRKTQKAFCEAECRVRMTLSCPGPVARGIEKSHSTTNRACETVILHSQFRQNRFMICHDKKDQFLKQ